MLDVFVHVLQKSWFKKKTDSFSDFWLTARWKTERICFCSSKYLYKLLRCASKRRRSVRWLLVYFFVVIIYGAFVCACVCVWRERVRNRRVNSGSVVMVMLQREHYCSFFRFTFFPEMNSFTLGFLMAQWNPVNYFWDEGVADITG